MFLLFFFFFLLLSWDHWICSTWQLWKKIYPKPRIQPIPTQERVSSKNKIKIKNSRPRSTISLLSMEITTDIIGLSLANSCTHNKPTCMHLNISISQYGSYIIGPIKAIMLFAFHNFHAWKHQNKIEILSIGNENYLRF